MKIFILEDDPARIRWMLENFDIEISLDITQDVSEALKWLNENKYDYIFLDHDLGGMTYVSSDEYQTGATVAKELHATKNVDSDVTVHSWNPPGAKVMMGYMESHGINCRYYQYQSDNFRNKVDKINSKFKRNQK